MRRPPSALDVKVFSTLFVIAAVGATVQAIGDGSPWRYTWAAGQWVVAFGYWAMVRVPALEKWAVRAASAMGAVLALVAGITLWAGHANHAAGLAGAAALFAAFTILVARRNWRVSRAR